MFPGQPEITGTVSLTTTTLNSHEAEFPVRSVAVYFTTVVPIGNRLPGGCVLVIVTLLQLSVATGTVQFTTASQDSGLAVGLISAGQLEIRARAVVTVVLK